MKKISKEDRFSLEYIIGKIFILKGFSIVALQKFFLDKIKSILDIMMKFSIYRNFLILTYFKGSFA